MAIQYKILILVALFGLSYGMAPVQNACAQLDESIPATSSSSSAGTIAKQTCDSQVWRTMEARARLETEREIMQNQNLIFKPDSILTYTCFDNFAAHASANVGVLFTHTTYWEGKEIIKWGKDNGMDEAMENTVIKALKPYLSGNFDHDLLGGRGGELNLKKSEPQAIGNKGRDYSCGKMAEVWAVAKCMNFLHTLNFAKNDGFFPFINLTAEAGGESVEGYEQKNDTRKFPKACDGTPLVGSDWKTMYRLSRNEENFGKVDLKYQFGDPLDKAFKEVRKMIKPSESSDCAPAVKTGVKVILSPASKETYEDGVCTNPGCSFDGKSGKCVESGTISGGTGGR